ncbi:MAG: DUF1848 family protein [Spirochaetales bacterium]|nr:DUF1848 family protein [Spirochaetales bacterium]
MINYRNKNKFLHSYKQYLQLVNNKATFIDIARCIDPACVEQPWNRLKFIADEFGIPRVVQIWTKNPGDVLRRGQHLLNEFRKDGTIVICQLTVTGFGPEFEPRVPWPVDWQGIDMMIDFLGTPRALLWRYDPVIPGISDLGMFEYLVRNFAQRGITRAVYNRGEYGLELVRKRMGHLYHRIDFTLDKNILSHEIEQTGRDHGIEFLVLAEGEQLAKPLNVSSRGCWQYEWLVQASDSFPSRDFLPGVFRPGCICAPSFDIGHDGQYEHCHGCVYCFAV